MKEGAEMSAPWTAVEMVQRVSPLTGLWAEGNRRYGADAQARRAGATENAARPVVGHLYADQSKGRAKKRSRLFL